VVAELKEQPLIEVEKVDESNKEMKEEIQEEKPNQEDSCQRL
jgi:hypothetical protein